MNTIINNNHILIKKYQIKSKKLIFEFLTELTFSLPCYIKPFGSSRTRYQNKNILDIKCQLKKKNNSLNHYQIIICKNEKQLSKSRNQKFFWGNKFDIVLEIWIPIIKLKLTHNILLQQIPNNYGKIEFNNIQKNTYKYGIVVPFYSRQEFVKQFLESLKKTDLSESLIVFIDESLTKDVNDDHISVNKLVSDFSLKTPLIKIYKNKHGNMFDSILYGLDLLYNYCDFLSTIDSDTIQKKDWLSEIYKSWNQCSQDYPDSNILVSGFNVESQHHSVIEKKEKYILKDSVGGCHMFFKKEIYINIIRRCLISHKWDTNIISNLRDSNHKVITTNPSVIQHIGKRTSIERNDLNTFDYVIDFDINND
jgi:hypothetical protein